MSNSGENEVGYAKPPRKHRFSAEHQPVRRRGTKLKSGSSDDLLRNIADALMAEVSFSLKGKNSKTKLSNALALRLVNQSVAGSVTDQIKFVQFLTSSGIIDFAKSQEALQTEFEGIAKENDERYAEISGYFFESLEGLISTTEWAAYAALMFLNGVSDCSCGVFDNDREAVTSIRTFHAQCVSGLKEVSQSKLHALVPGWLSGMRDRLGGPAPDRDHATGEPGQARQAEFPERGGTARGPLADDLTAGMIGND